MKDWIARHPLSSFFVIAYGVSWSIAVPLALQAQGLLPQQLPWSLHYLTAFGPAAAAFLVTRRLQKPPGKPDREQPSSLVRSIFWWTVGFGSPLLLFGIALAAARIAGQAGPAWTSLGRVNFLPDLGVMAWGLWFLTSGFGEELGWRGFALPRLQRTHSAMTSTLLVSLGWAGWHLPAFFYLPTYTAMGLSVLPGFLLGVLAGAIVLTWLYNSSGGSVLAAALWHASFNFVTASPDAGGLVAAVTSTLVMVWAVAVAWRCNWATLATPPTYGLPLLLTRVKVRVVHFIMDRRQLLGIARRAEAASLSPSAFRTPEGEAAFVAAYDAGLQAWPVSFEEMSLATRFGMTHVIASGPANAPPLVLLHGYMATSVMWAPNIADFSKNYRIYAIDVMGQPSKSIPGEPIRSTADYVAWLTATLDALHLGRIALVGMSFGGWLALTYAAAAPARVQKLVLLSPGGVLPLSRQLMLRGMLMMFFPTRFTVNFLMRWAGLSAEPGENDARPLLNLMYLGARHFRMPENTLRVAPNPLTDEELREMQVPVLLLVGDREVIYDASAALSRARRLIPHFEGELVRDCSHDMCFSQRRIVDARILEFLEGHRRRDSERVVA
jgi:pimeloyl-ACP methyl ester carboxylesterase/membrane protease YdiL (CAAX protease family)